MRTRIPVISAVLAMAVLALVLALVAKPARAQDAATHDVAPGDTWAALAYRYGVAPDALWAANDVINVGREPIIGATIRIPRPGGGAMGEGERNGALIRPIHRSRLLTALRHTLPPVDLEMANPPGDAPLLHPDIALFVAHGSALPRDLPPTFTTLDLSRVPAVPGQALAFRAALTQPAVVSTTLDAPLFGPLPFETLVDPPHAVGVRGTGAFFATGPHELTIHVAGHAPWSQPWLMADGAWTYEEVNFTGAAAAIDAQAIADERIRLFGVWDSVTPGVLWTSGFQEPIDDYLRLSSLYGARRSYNGGPYSSYHEGVDFAAYGGTPVYAPADGVVVVAEALYVRGGAVIIDHGLGIYSGAYHLSQVSAERGQIVRAGDKIGEVGTTGLSTGNHLHWDFLVTSTWVDASKWVEQGLGCWLLEGLGRPCAIGNP